METPKPLVLRLPPNLLMSVLVLLGLVMIPVFLLVVMALVSQLSKGSVTMEVAGMFLAVVLGFPIAVVLWRRARRANTVRAAWILAVVGVLVLGGVSAKPIFDVGTMFYEK